MFNRKFTKAAVIIISALLAVILLGSAILPTLLYALS